MLSICLISINQSWSDIQWFHELKCCSLLTLGFPNLWLFYSFLQSCQAVFKKNFKLLSRENRLQFFQMSRVCHFCRWAPIVTQDLRWGLDFIVTFFSFNNPRAYLPLILYACVCHSGYCYIIALRQIVSLFILLGSCQKDNSTTKLFQSVKILSDSPINGGIFEILI